MLIESCSGKGGTRTYTFILSLCQAFPLLFPQLAKCAFSSLPTPLWFKMHQDYHFLDDRRKGLHGDNGISVGLKLKKRPFVFQKQEAAWWTVPKDPGEVKRNTPWSYRIYTAVLKILGFILMIMKKPSNNFRQEGSKHKRIPLVVELPHLVERRVHTSDITLRAAGLCPVGEEKFCSFPFSHGRQPKSLY